MQNNNVDLVFFGAGESGPARCHLSVNASAINGVREFDPSAASPQFVAFEDLNRYIDQFHKDLEVVREEARSAYAAYERQYPAWKKSA